MSKDRPYRRITIVLTTLPLLLISAWGQTSRRTKEEKRATAGSAVSQRTIELESLIVQTHAVPAEFAIDALLRITSSNQSVSADRKKELLEHAFALTSEVQNPLRRKALVLPGSPVDTRSGYRTYAFNLGLDSLTLRSRIVIAMLSLDKQRAREMLNDVSPKLPLKPLTCSDALVYEVGEFYQMLAKVAQTTFDEKQIEQGERLQFLLPYVEAMSSPSQVGPIATLIVSLRLPVSELLPLSQAYSKALRTISGDDRSFSDALTRGRTVNSVFTLVKSYGKEAGPYKEVRDAFRAYLLKNLQFDRCIDNAPSSANDLPSYVKEANFMFADRQFTVDDVKPARVDQAANVVRYYETRDSAKLLTDLKSLVTDDTDEPITEEMKAASQWQQKMLDYLGRLETWDGHDEPSSIDYFHQKCVLYFGLAKIVPPSAAREQVILSYVKTLNQDAIQKESRIEWLMHAKELFQIVRETKGVEHSKLLERLTYSNNPVLSLYARLMQANLV